MRTQQHWDQVYATKAVTGVSWFQPEAEQSLRLISAVAPTRDARVLDVGAGASTLVDGLLAAGFARPALLDLAAAALDASKARLGAAAAGVDWYVGDVLTYPFPPAQFDVWHDRAVFHFLTTPADRARYVSQVRRALKPGGHVVIGTFAEDGPTRCSGLAVCRYSAEALHAEFGDEFHLVTAARETHITPSGAEQRFQYCVCAWRGALAGAGA